tara:strand:- start:122 stop:586 length:465 start_codon:yes stop_codon:yes gene_type:complete
MDEKKTNRTFDRIDDLQSGDWRPLTIDEMRRLYAVKLSEGTYPIDRLLLGMVMGERERLVYVCEAARWVAESIQAMGLITERPMGDAPTELEKSVELLSSALEAAIMVKMVAPTDIAPDLGMDIVPMPYDFEMGADCYMTPDSFWRAYDPDQNI